MPVPTPRLAPVLAIALASCLAAEPAAGQECADEPAYSALDFWVGEWDVFVGDQRVGTSRIERILDGCAVTEDWADVRGGEGRSLFYYLPWTEEWKQVWVTPRATTQGGVKEKTLVSHLEDGGVRFQGQVPDAAGTMWFDRTTLRPLPGGLVDQHIEVSRDGETWRTTFRAEYRPSATDTN